MHAEYCSSDYLLASDAIKTSCDECLRVDRQILRAEQPVQIGARSRQLSFALYGMRVSSMAKITTRVVSLKLLSCLS